MRRSTVVLFALLALPLGGSHAQQPQPTFRVTANYIEVDATVTDARGAFVRDLTPDDFEIVDEGKPQNVTVLSLVDLPFERPDRPLYRAAAVEPDVMSNATADSGRIYVIVLDAYHVGPARTTDTRIQARQFIEKYFGANDVAAVVHVGAPMYGQEFTSSRRRLLAAIDRFVGQKGPSAAAAINADAIARQNIASTGFTPGTPVDTEDPIRAYLARESLRTIRQVAEQLATVTGRRKAMMLFSEGIDYDTMEGPIEVVNRRAVVRDAGQVLTAERDMVAAATRANVSIYTFDPRGLATGVEDVQQLGTLVAGSTVPLGQMSTEMHRAQDTLRMFAGETGGRSSLDRNEPSLAFERMMRDSSTYYMLGYNSSAPRDGRFHKVTVKVKRPGLEVRARQGYYAGAAVARNAKEAPPPDPIARLLTAAMPSGGLGLRVNAGVVRIDDARAGQTSRPAVVHVTVEVAGKDIGFEPSGPLFTNDVEVRWQVFDEKGQRKVSDGKKIGLKLLPTNRDLVASRGVRHVVEMRLVPGRYQLRIAARERVAGHAGSVFYEIEVPDPAKQPLTLSDLLLTSASANGMFTTGESPAIGLQLPAPVTTDRTFTRTDTIAAAATVIVDDASRAYTIDLTTTLRADDGTIVFKKEDSRSSTEVGRNGYLSVTAIPLERIAAGDYVVAIEARSRLGALVTRESAIVVK